MSNFETFYSNLLAFIKQSKTNDLTTKNYIKEYLGTKVKVSFGQGTPAKISWISFLKDDQKVSNGYYPCLLLDKVQNKLYLVYGISEQNKPENNWPKEILENNNKLKKIKNISKIISNKYPNSLFFKEYDSTNIDQTNFEKDLNSLIKKYNSTVDQIDTESYIGRIFTNI